ncbi:MAG: hypothetical protein HYY02_03045 [Chloroflexi bacterium]|nr:hypothetical protein [Chloroflexota bacterium]
MDRREFLKTTGIGSLGLMALPTLHDLFELGAVAAAAAGESNFYVVAVSAAGTVDNVQHTVVVAGSGSFRLAHAEGGGMLQGGGPFLHFDNAAPAPKPVIGAGTWTARRYVNYAPLGNAGPLQAGVLELLVDLNAQVPSPAVLPARLRIVCNIGAANLLTGKPEGFVLAIPGTPFVQGGAAGPFRPLHPELGLTAFTPGAEVGAFDAAWEQEFQRLHGGAPTAQDRADRLYSLEIFAREGRSPTEAEWLARWQRLQEWNSLLGGQAIAE